VAALVDTNVLVYRFDCRFPAKQRVATDVLRRGIEAGTLRLAHQAVVEFVAAATRPMADGAPLLTLLGVAQASPVGSPPGAENFFDQVSPAGERPGMIWRWT